MASQHEDGLVHQASHYRCNEAASGLNFRQPQPLSTHIGEAVKRQIGLSENSTKPRTKKGGDYTKTKQHLFEKYFSSQESSETWTEMSPPTRARTSTEEPAQDGPQ